MIENVEVTVQIAGVDVLAGTLFTRASRGIESSTFRYATEYLLRPDAYQLDPALPLTESSSHTPPGKALFNAFTDSAPDRWGRMLMKRAERDRAAEFGVAERQFIELDYLLGTSDQQRQGAIRYRHVGSAEFLAGDEAGVPNLVSLPELIRAADDYSKNTASVEEVRDLLHAGGSLGGARPKAAIIDHAGRLCIAKFPKEIEDEDWNVIGWEKTALDLARSSGIDAVIGQLIRIGDRNAMLVPRFDRRGETRIGYISALTALESSDGETGRGYLEIVEWLEQNSAAAVADANELWRRILFSIAIGNTDDHLRNHGFVRTNRGWRLAPAFDLNPTPGTGIKYLKTAVGFDDTRADVRLALDLADYFSLTSLQARGIVAEVLEALQGWRVAANRNRLGAHDLEVMAPALDKSIGEMTALR